MLLSMPHPMAKLPLAPSPGGTKGKPPEGAAGKFRHWVPTWSNRTRVAARQRSEGDEARDTISSGYAGWIYEIRRQAQRTLAIETVYDALSEVVVVNAVAAADRTSSVSAKQLLEETGISSRVSKRRRCAARSLCSPSSSMAACR